MHEILSAACADLRRYKSNFIAFGGRKRRSDNHDEDELVDFRILARGYAALSDRQIARLLQDKDLMEICHAGES
jgi:hypothetical protein